MFNLQQTQILEGLLLGDGGMPKPAKNGNTYLSIERKLEDKEYLLYHAQIFEKYLGDKGITYRTRFHPKTKRAHHSIILRTKQNEFFGQFYKKWYPNGKKQIPRSVELCPVTVATWFADDGCVSVHKNYKNLISLKLSTNGFNKEDVEFLQTKLKETYLVKFLLFEEKKNQFVLRLCKTQDVKLFLRKIDQYFPSSMSRKSDRWRSNDFQLWYDEVKLPFTYDGFCIKCKSTAIWKYSVIDGMQRYRCKECGKQFMHNDFITLQYPT